VVTVCVVLPACNVSDSGDKLQEDTYLFIGEDTPEHLASTSVLFAPTLKSCEVPLLPLVQSSFKTEGDILVVVIPLGAVVLQLGAPPPPPPQSGLHDPFLQHLPPLHCVSEEQPPPLPDGLTQHLATHEYPGPQSEQPRLHSVGLQAANMLVGNRNMRIIMKKVMVLNCKNFMITVIKIITN